jgi:hypothetical protein
MRQVKHNEYIGGGRIRPSYVMTYEGHLVSQDYRSGHQLHKDRLVEMGFQRKLFKIKFKK